MHLSIPLVAGTLATAMPIVNHESGETGGIDDLERLLDKIGKKIDQVQDRREKSGDKGPILDFHPSVTAPQCIGIGISVCDPIHVGDNNDNRVQNRPGHQQNDRHQPEVKGEPQESEREDEGAHQKNKSTEDFGPTTTGPGCVGVGISACDPIHVGDNNDNRSQNPEEQSSGLQSEFKGDHRSGGKNDHGRFDGEEDKEGSHKEKHEKHKQKEEHHKNKDGKHQPDKPKCIGIGIANCDPVHVGAPAGDNFPRPDFPSPDRNTPANNGSPPKKDGPGWGSNWNGDDLNDPEYGHRSSYGDHRGGGASGPDWNWGEADKPGVLGGGYAE